MRKKLEEEHRRREEEAGSPLRQKKSKLPTTVTSKVTKRPHLKIMEKLKQKIADKLREKLGAAFGNDIILALGDKGVDLQIKALVKQDKLKIIDSSNKPVYEKEMMEEINESYKNLSSSKPFSHKNSSAGASESSETPHLKFTKDSLNFNQGEYDPAQTKTRIVR